MAKCKASNQAGQPCKAIAKNGKDFCFFHDPDKAEERLASKKKGGKAGKLAVLHPDQVKPWRGKPGDVDVMQDMTTADLVNLLSDTIDEVRVGAIDPRVANSVGYLGGILLRVMQHEAFDQRLTAIERALMLDR